VTSLVPNYEGAKAFLDLVHPGRRRILSAINPLAEKGREEIVTKTFGTSEGSKVEKFIESAHKRGWNVYYTVNGTIGPMTKKPLRSDLAEVFYLHVDVDPRKPDDEERKDMAAFMARERERILGLLTAPPMGIPLPTAVIYSGGGYNALWQLKEPLPITGEDDKARLKCAEELKHYNRQLERAFGGDNCHNLDRILRLVGSVNFPNHVKIKSGRTEPTGPAEVIFWESDRVYPITDFTPAPTTREQTSGAPPRFKPTPGAIARVKDLDQLDLTKIPKTAELVRRVIMDGRDVQDPQRFCDPTTGKFDRSRATYFVSCQLAAAGISGDVRYAIFTDPKYGISESILEKGSALERHAERIVERGDWGAECEELDELNGKHAVISSLGGQCVVVQEEKTPGLGRTRLTVSSFADIVKRYSHRKIQIGSKMTRGGVEQPIYQSLGQFWLDNPRRLQYEGLIFAPGRDTPGYYNLWQGFAVEPIEGDCSLFLAHLKDVVCNGREDYYEYLLNWMAFAVQRPDEPAEVAVVFRGEPGTGKGVVAREFGKLFGRHFLQVTNSTHLIGQFNDHLRDCVFLFLDEAFFAGDVKHKSILKNLVTEPEIMIEKKGVDAALSRNHLHIMMASNEKWVIPADPKERRYFVLDVPSHRRGMAHKDYWKNLYGQMDKGGREALLYLLKARNIEGYAPREFPETSALAEQKMMSLSTLQEWWYGKLLGGQLHATHVRWTNPVIIERLTNDYLLYANKTRGRVSVATELGRFLKKVAPGVKATKDTLLDRDTAGNLIKVRHRTYRFPPLAECRAAWDAEFGFTSDWPEEDDDTEDGIPENGF
jgi:hypothetical protein